MKIMNKIGAAVLTSIVAVTMSTGLMAGIALAADAGAEAEKKLSDAAAIGQDAPASDESDNAEADNSEEDGEVSADTVILRVCSWEEYIDEGGWDEDEVIDLESGDIFGENSMIEDFEDWYYETYGIKVKVEYSTFGTNEDLYNMLNLGDVYDLVCPSEYMFMKLIAEGRAQKLSDEFFDESNEYNYYIRGLSPFIRDIFENHEINGESWMEYAAGYTWGITGIVYNPDYVDGENISWQILDDSQYSRQVTIKDNVRDSYFAAVGAIKHDLLTSEEFLNAPDYSQRLEEEMNDVSSETLAEVLDYLQDVKNNVYSFETDSGKADMITGKVVANYQWSGDAVYTMDQADEDDYTLNFAVPVESSNIYFDGWLMLKSGVEGNQAKQHAAEAFINFLSRPDNAIRNMYYIGYTSVISGGDDTSIFEYIDWNYGAEEDDEDTVEYSLGYYFSGVSDDEDYILTVPAEQTKRQLGAQYPSEENISRTSIMIYFDEDVSQDINKMWINVRCINIGDIPVWVWPVAGVIIAAIVIAVIRKKNVKY